MSNNTQFIRLYQILALVLVILPLTDAGNSFGGPPYVAFGTGTGKMVSGSNSMYITIGQSAAGFSSAGDGNYISVGFWQNFGPDASGCCTVAGDANNNGAVNLIDVTFLINYLYKGGPAPACRDRADASGNNVINLLDVTHLINYLYRGGTAPVCGTTGL